MSCIHFLRWLVGVLCSVAGIFWINEAGKSSLCSDSDLWFLCSQSWNGLSLLFFTFRITVGSGQQTFPLKSVVVRRVSWSYVPWDGKHPASLGSVFFALSFVPAKLLWKTFSYISSHGDDSQLRRISLVVDIYPHLNVHSYEMPPCLNMVLLSLQTVGALLERPS